MGASIFFTAAMIRAFRYVPTLLRDLADLKAQIIGAVKNNDALMMTRV
jgi:hypothetical protein